VILSSIAVRKLAILVCSASTGISILMIDRSDELNDGNAPTCANLERIRVSRYCFVNWILILVFKCHHIIIMKKNTGYSFTFQELPPPLLQK
jgi:hypothetical protein